MRGFSGERFSQYPTLSTKNVNSLPLVQMANLFFARCPYKRLLRSVISHGRGCSSFCEPVLFIGSR